MSALCGAEPAGALEKTLATGSESSVFPPPAPSTGAAVPPPSAVSSRVPPPAPSTGTSSGTLQDTNVAVSVAAAKGSTYNAFLVGLDAFIGSECREAESEVDANDTPDTETAPLPIVSPSKPADQNLDEPDDETMRVMKPELQEEQLIAHYALLASIGYYRSIISPGSTPESFDHPPCITYDEILRFFSRDAIW
ncbi:hypothetical protein ARMSODRAFT_1022525 [Armillaria solidipes]|uniref:Uncharacterized protein n=1 Tax=Armillaria solidipes TaxID=1076256 RepID=A0A2H3B5Z7_9AGAR|nr:hypothetical protein ARMSODRAFT_1022525 [Armillaria solidipes]